MIDPHRSQQQGVDIEALASSPRFHAIRAGATIVASGLSLKDQLSQLLELTVTEVDATSGAFTLLQRSECACAAVHVTGTPEDELRRMSQTPGSRLVTHLLAADEPGGRISLLFEDGHTPDIEDRTMLDLLSMQMTSALMSNRDAWQSLLIEG